MQGSLRRTGVVRLLRNRHIVVKLVEATLKGNLSLAVKHSSRETAHGIDAGHSDGEVF